MSTHLNSDHRVVVLSDSGPIPSYFVRIADPLDRISDNWSGFPYYDPAVEKSIDTADLLIVQRWLYTPARYIVENAKLRGIPIVYETDDNLLDLPNDSSMRMSPEMIANLEAVLEMADLVICSTKTLADRMAQYNPCVEVIENYGLDLPEADARGRPHLAVVNTDYFKLRRNKTAFFAAIAKAIETQNYRVSFFGTIGQEMIDLKNLYPKQVNIVDGFMDNRAEFVESLSLRGINVAIVPLDDDEQHLIKSDIKYLDFASFGVPGIYNNVRVYEAVRHEVDGYITRDSEEGWLEGLCYFADEENRRRCGRAAREVVQNERNLQKYVDRLSNICGQLITRKNKLKLPAVDVDRSGLFWQKNNLYFLYNGRKNHIISKNVIATLINRGFGLIEPRMEELALSPLNMSLSKVEQLYGIAAQRISAIATPASGRALKIAWIVPRLLIGGGGHRNIIRCAYHLEKLGHSVSLHFIDSHDPGHVVRAQVREHFYPFEGYVGLLDENFGRHDIVFVTHWSTVSHAERFKENIGEIVYFVQDFEPFFYAMGSEYVLAENTYRKGYYAITSGIWCEHFLRNSYNSEADHFQFPIDRKIYFNQNIPRCTSRIIFFAKPEMPRRCYELGLQALRAFHKLRPDVEIVFYGSTHQTDVDFPVTQLGMLGGPVDLAKLYNEATIGIAFSTTNPSLVPYEMMACGLPVLDLGRPGNEVNYDNSFEIARLANPDPAFMAMELAELISSPSELQERSRQGLAFAATFPVEEDVGKRIEQLLLRRVRKWPVASIECLGNPWANPQPL